MNIDDDLSKELESLQKIYNQIVSELSVPGYMQEFLGDSAIPETDEILPKDGSVPEPNINQNPRKNRKPRKSINTSSNEEKKKAKYDGSTPSLPHDKNGPYTCSKCNDVFISSQKFASHVNSVHYKFETTTEKNERLSAKKKGRKFQIVQTSEGLTVMPVSTSPEKTPADPKNKGKQPMGT